MWPRNLPKDAHAQPEDVGRQGREVASERLAITRIVGAVSRELRVAARLGLLHAFDHLDEIVDANNVSVEDHGDPTGQGVDLGPMDTPCTVSKADLAFALIPSFPAGSSPRTSIWARPSPTHRRRRRRPGIKGGPDEFRQRTQEMGDVERSGHLYVEEGCGCRAPLATNRRRRGTIFQVSTEGDCDHSSSEDRRSLRQSDALVPALSSGTHHDHVAQGCRLDDAPGAQWLGASRPALTSVFRAIVGMGTRVGKHSSLKFPED